MTTDIIIPEAIKKAISKEAIAFADDQVFGRNKFRMTLANVGQLMGEFGFSLAVKEIDELKTELEFQRREYERYKKIDNDSNEKRDAEIERLNIILEKLSNGEAMQLVRESDGIYSVIFKNK